MKINIDNNDTLYTLFQKRVKKSPDVAAYYQFDYACETWKTYTWNDCADLVAQYRRAMLVEDLVGGDRVGMMLHNCVEWIIFDQAAISLGLVTVPLFSEDNANNCAYILRDAGVRLLLVGNQRQLQKIQSQRDTLAQLDKVICCEALSDTVADNIVHLTDWLLVPQATQSETQDLTVSKSCEVSDDTLATLVYTSGTTGHPKGVMLTHRNVVTNVLLTNQVFDFNVEDLFVSFLPLSHIFERVGGYYLTMMLGARVAFARSITTLLEDIRWHQPTALLSVPRIYERIYSKVQQKFSLPPMRLLLQICVAIGYRRYQQIQAKKSTCWIQPAWIICDKIIAAKVRAILGGKIHCTVSGGAPMPTEVARFFLAFGVPLYQGYGLTEASPVVAVNRPHTNLPESIGPPIPGIEVRIDDNNELLTRSDCIMQGYWGLSEATMEAIDAQGWLHTGDLAKMDDAGRLFITGRIKEIIVMSNGEKVAPADIEMVIVSAGLASQIMIYGEGRPFLIALIVPTEEISAAYDAVTLAAMLKKSIAKQMKDFPSYARIRRVLIIQTPWTIENGMLTPTLKLKRQMIVNVSHQQIEAVYRDF